MKLRKIIEYLVVKMNTNDLIEFQWKMTDSEDEPILITIDANSSVVPDAAGGLTGIFDCCKLIRNREFCSKLKKYFVFYGLFLGFLSKYYYSLLLLYTYK